MGHERSETIQDEKTGKWVNVYGRDTPQAGQRLPKDASGYGHRDYDSVKEAVAEARRRSKLSKHEHKLEAEDDEYANGGLIRDYRK